MDSRITEIRREIREVRLKMLDIEALMRGQINRNEECSVSAGKMLSMRAEMSRLVRERERLGDREPISIDRHFWPRRQLVVQKPTSPGP